MHPRFRSLSAQSLLPGLASGGQRQRVHTCIGRDSVRLNVIMRPLFRSLSVLILLLGLASAGQSQQVHTYIDRDSVRAGEILQYTVVLDRESDVRQIHFPDQSVIESDTLLYLSRERHQVTAYRDSVVYRLQFFGLEDYRIPRYPIHLISQDSDTTTLYSNSVPIFFKTILAEGDDTFRPMKPIFEFTASFWPLIALLILISLFGWYIYKRYQSRKPEPPKPAPYTPVPFSNPFDRLEAALHSLQGSHSPLARDDFKEFYVELGDSIRRYFDDVYEIDALEMTSREILQALQAYPADSRVIQITRKVFNEADMVKFAKFEPTRSQSRKSLDIAFEFLETVRRIDTGMVSMLQEKHEEAERIKTETTLPAESQP